MIRELFAIRHKPSGGFLPVVRYGYTHSEPSETAIPRLFTTRGGAQRALTWWLKGITVVRMLAAGFSWDGPNDPEEDWDTKAMPERKAEDMEVVPVLLKL